MSTPSSSPRPIYVVDDSPDDLFLIRRIFARAGLGSRVRTFQFGQSALMRLRRLAQEVDPSHRDFPEAIVVDGNMPGLDGFALLETLRATAGFATTRLIMLSGSQRPEDRERALRHGADHYFVKFPSPGELAAAVGLPGVAAA